MLANRHSKKVRNKLCTANRHLKVLVAKQWYITISYSLQKEDGKKKKLVTNCNLSSWREVLKEVLTYIKVSRKYMLEGRLGDRLKEKELNLDKIVYSWLDLEDHGG